jgi:tRNA U54 and U55 pseudouridine synthase Pus10
MPLCATCLSVDIIHLLDICLRQCRDQQVALSQRDSRDDALPDYEGSEVKHHSDIFEIEKSSEDCDLCKIIFQAFKKIPVKDVEAARDRQIVYRAVGSRIEVWIRKDTKELVRSICTLGVYMDELDGEYNLLNSCGGTHHFLQLQESSKCFR